MFQLDRWAYRLNILSLHLLFYYQQNKHQLVLEIGDKQDSGFPINVVNKTSGQKNGK